MERAGSVRTSERLAKVQPLARVARSGIRCCVLSPGSFSKNDSTGAVAVPTPLGQRFRVTRRSARCGRRAGAIVSLVVDHVPLCGAGLGVESLSRFVRRNRLPSTPTSWWLAWDDATAGWLWLNAE